MRVRPGVGRHRGCGPVRQPPEAAPLARSPGNLPRALRRVGLRAGHERAVIPLIAQRQFGIASASAVLSFIVSFGVTKALTNFFAGGLSDRFGRKGVLVAGWLMGLPVPLLILWAPAWGWVVAANVL